MTLDVQHLTVTAPGGTTVLDGVSLSIAAGECLAVVGESGAGKSVLARTLLGLTQRQPRWRTTAERWTLRLAPPTPAGDWAPHPSGAQDLRGISPREWRRLRGKGIGLVLQDALQSLDPLRTIESEIGETLAIRGVRRGERRSRAVEAMARAGLPDPENLLKRRSEQLSGGMRQRALIASALVGDPSLIIADEPTTALDPANSARILDLFRRQCDDGRALLLISHDLRAVESIADRIAVLDRGRMVEVGTVDEILRRPQHTATKRLVAAIPQLPKQTSTDSPNACSHSAHTALLITLRGATRSFDSGAGVHDIDLDLHRAEAVGLVGESGAGKTTLARLLVGADRPDTGEIHAAPGARVRLIPQDPLSTFDPRWRVDRIIASSIPAGSEHTPAELLESVGLDPAMLRRRPATLSGGERQRVAIARALGAEPDALVCDEPVSALDASTQAGVLELLRELQRHGLALVFVSHDLDAVHSLCDRVIELRDGRITADEPTDQASITNR